MNDVFTIIVTYILIRIEFSQERMNGGSFRRSRFSDEQNRSFDSVAQLKEPIASAGIDGWNQDFVELSIGIVHVFRH